MPEVRHPRKHAISVRATLGSRKERRWKVIRYATTEARDAAAREHREQNFEVRVLR